MEVITLGEPDLLEWLGYSTPRRHPLKILGYDDSTRGARRFREERPNVLPEACRLIEMALAEAGLFPREPGPGVLEDGVYLERRPGGIVALHRSDEVSFSQTARVHIDFGTAREAAWALLRLLCDPAYLPAADPPSGT